VRKCAICGRVRHAGKAWLFARAEAGGEHALSPHLRAIRPGAAAIQATPASTGGIARAGTRSAPRPPVQIEATLTKADLRSLFERFAPLTIRLGGDDELTLDGPLEVTLDPKAGVRIVCKAKVRWSVLGLHVPVTVRSLSARVVPAVRRDEKGGEALVFRLALDDADIAALPGVFDATVLRRVNEELAKKHVELAWNFHGLLDRVFALPDSVETAAALGMRVTSSAVRMSGEALSFCVRLDVTVKRRPAADPHRHAS
jgi:hypothetical protein